MNTINNPHEAENKTGSFSLSYSLTYEEAYETFFLLAAKRSPKSRRIISAVLLVLAAVLIVFYGLNPYNLEYFVLPLLALATFAGVAYYPSLKARSGAKKVARSRGVYKVEFFSDGHIKPFNGQKLPLSNDRDARAFETEALFAIRPDRVNTFCLPKRAMKGKEVELARDTLKKYINKFQNSP